MSTVKINETTFSITSTLTMAQLKTLHTKAPQALQLTKPGKKSGDDDEIIFAIAPSAKQSMSTYGICFAKSAFGTDNAGIEVFTPATPEPAPENDTAAQ